MEFIKRIFTVTCLILITFSTGLFARTAGAVDPAFSPRLVDVDYVFYTGSIERTSVRKVAVQPDGKIVAAGLFNVVNDAMRDNIVRFNADGTLDPGFNPPALARFNGNQLLIITALARQSDGKILIGGNFTTTGAVRRTNLARLNADGSLDTSFNANQPGNSLGGTVVDIEISADGKITVGGDISVSAGGRKEVARLLPDGTIDNSFNPQMDTANSTGSLDTFVQADGKTLVSLRYSSGGSRIYRLNIDGSVDFSHMIDGGSRVVNRMIVQPNGKILVAGSFDMIDGFPIQEGILRLNADGSFDTTFNLGNSGAGGTISDVEFLSNGKILIGGSFGSYNDVSRQYLAVLNDDGSLDDSFSYTPGRVLGVYDLALQSDGKIVVGTYVDQSQGTFFPPIARLNTDATIDASIDPFMGSAGNVNKILVQPDGKILIAGFYNHIERLFRRNFARFNNDGTIDSSFSSSIFFPNPLSTLLNLALQPDAKIIATGGIPEGARLNPDGSHDARLRGSPPPGIAYVLPDGKILGLTDRTQRFSADCFLETEATRFNFGGAPVRAAVLPDGKIIVVGTFTEVNFSAARGRIARLNADTTFDPTWDTPGGGANNKINDILLQADGKLIIGGAFTTVNGNSNYKYLARLNADGTLDTSFNPVLNGEVISLKMQPDGKILFSGAMTTVNGISRNSVARVNSNGTQDASFDLGSGADGTVRTIDLQPDGKILIGGDFRRVNGVERLGVARLLNNTVQQTKLFDYDGDGRADVSVFRPSTSRWYEFLSGTATVVEKTFGVSGDIVSPADFDGDGKTDIAIYRPSTGDWWYLSSANNAQNQVHWGANGDIPRPSDFDGDGKADFVIFRPSENNWYRLGSTGQVSIVNFGLSGDKPLTGDFDGDGKSDVAMFRPSTGTWWYRSSVNNAQIATQFGISTDIPTPADFDGDGKTDIAVYRPSNGNWYIINSVNGTVSIVNFGLAEDKPVAADYDGDGKADIAVFRPSTGIWYMLRSTQGFSAQQFGISTDIPTPNAFVP
ncbi:MAG: VCBS repeat-containing protein [Pyrinomonadaceae bacterium]|nr:VCBS repeat-containing protein [Pyrinomonadaceae bacterium]